MRGVRIVPVLLLVLGMAGCASADGEEEEDGEGGGEAAVALEGVPAYVREAAVAAVPGMEALRASRETEGGVVYFEISGKTAGGDPVDVLLTEGGEVVEVECAVPLASVPAPAVAAARARLPGLEILAAERCVKGGVASYGFRGRMGGVTTYEFRGRVRGKACEIVVSPEGEVLEVEE